MKTVGLAATVVVTPARNYMMTRKAGAPTAMVGVRTGVTIGLLMLLSIAMASGVLLTRESLLFAFSPLSVFALLLAGYFAQALVWREPWAVSVLVMTAIVVFAADIRGTGGVGARAAGFDAFAAIKLGIFSLAFLAGVLTLPRTLGRFVTLPGALLALYLGWIAVTAPFSDRPIYTLGMAFGVSAWVLLAAAANDILEERQVVRAVVAAGAVFCILSLVFFVAVPDVGRMETLGTVRLIGISSAATTAGHIASIVIVSIVAFFLSGHHREDDYGALDRLLLAAAGSAAVAVFVLAQSRGAATALGTAVLVLVLQRRKLLPPFLYVVFFAGIAAAIALLVSPTAIEALVEAATGISRRGSVDEVASLAGRTTIWTLAIENIMEAPVIGHGYGAGSYILGESAWNRWGNTTGSAHNAFLQTALDLGFVGVAILAGLFAWSIHALVRHPSPFRDGMFVMVLFSSLLESSIGKAPSAFTFLWLVSILSTAKPLGEDQTKDHLPASGAVESTRGSP